MSIFSLRKLSVKSHTRLSQASRAATRDFTIGNAYTPQELQERHVYESGEAHFKRDLDELNANTPTWDYDSRVKNAVIQLKNGMSKDVVKAIFGDKLFREAESIIEQASQGITE